MGDDRNIIFLNACGTVHDVSDSRETFLKYVAGEISGSEGDDYVARIDQEAQMAKKNVSWRIEYMNWKIELEDAEEIAHREGRKEGPEEGRNEYH